MTLTSTIVEVLRWRHDLQTARNRLSAPSRTRPAGHHSAQRHTAEQPRRVQLQRANWAPSTSPATSMSKSQKFRNIAHNDKVAFVVDDIASRDPWRVRCLEIRGTAEQARHRASRAGAAGDELDTAIIRITPRRIISFGIDDHRHRATPAHDGQARREGSAPCARHKSPLLTAFLGAFASLNRERRYRPGFVDRQVRQHGAARLPELSLSQPNSQPAAPVTSTVPITDSPVLRASAMCHRPKAPACSSWPHRGAERCRRDRCQCRAEGGLLGPGGAERDPQQQPLRRRFRHRPRGERGAYRRYRGRGSDGDGHRSRRRSAPAAPPTTAPAAAARAELG